MPKLPTVTGKEAVAAFEKAGFEVVRTAASHKIMKKDGHTHLLSIPVHRNENLKTGLLRAQIRTAGLTVEEFIELL